MRIFSTPANNLPPVREPSGSQAPVSTDLWLQQDSFVKESASAGANLGFKIGCGLSIIGLPLAICLSNSQSKVIKCNGRVRARTAKKRLPYVAAICAPGVLLGAVGAGIGGAIGAISGKIKAAKRCKTLAQREETVPHIPTTESQKSSFIF